MTELIYGDCLEKMKDIPDGSVDMVLVDPPYGVTACKWDTVIPLEPLWKEYERIVKSNGIIVIFGSEPFSSRVRMSNIKRYRYDWIWKKPTGTGYMMANKQPLNDYENIMVFYSSDIMNDTTLFFEKSKDYLIGEKKKAEAAGYNLQKVLGNYMGSHYFTRKTQFAFPKREDYEKLQTTGFFQREYDEAKREYDEAKRRVCYNPQFSEGKPYTMKRTGTVEIYDIKSNPTEQYDGKRYPKRVLSYNYDKDNGYAPTQKPVPLLEYLIKTYTNPGETVLDNCMGSGSTGVACINTGRKFIGIEKEEQYYEIAKKRISQAINKKMEEEMKKEKE